jgi:uncharacterized protein YndB with AHSA1/START domain
VSDLPPIRREVRVDLDPDRAFELFTARIGDWWPLATHSVFGADASVTFTDDKLVETLGEQTTVWAEVLEWQPGALLIVSWHAGQPEAESTRVSVSFTDQGEQTLVVVEHSGWEARQNPAAIRREYDQGWPTVLGSYTAAVTASTRRDRPSRLAN